MRIKLIDIITTVLYLIFRRPIVSLKLIIKPYTAGILSPTKEQDQDFKNLESLEQGILEWVNKMVQIQKEE